MEQGGCDLPPRQVHIVCVDHLIWPETTEHRKCVHDCEYAAVRAIGLVAGSIGYDGPFMGFPEIFQFVRKPLDGFGDKVRAGASQTVKIFDLSLLR